MLVSPAFHGYWRAIETALAARGHVVSTHRYDERSTTAKIRHKLLTELPSRLRRDARESAGADLTPGAVEAVRAHRPDVVVTVKGDLMGPAYWDAVTASGAARVTWLYDELRRLRYDDNVLPAIGPVCSYSSHDVATLTDRGVDATHLPLAHDTRCAFTPRRSDEIAFVGARYPNREALLVALHRAQVPVRAHGRDWSAHPADRARTWRASGARVPAGRDLDRGEAYGVMAGARAALNVHGDQDGFTMRTFEASGVGALQLVDRADLGTADALGRFGDLDREVLVFDGADELVDLARRAGRDRSWADGIREAGRARVLAQHTFDHRVAHLEDRWA